MYRIHPEGIEKGVMRLSDTAWIPASEGNKDWKAYLAWVAAGNQPLPAENKISDRVRVVNELKQDALNKTWDQLAPVQKKVVMNVPVSDEELGIVE